MNVSSERIQTFAAQICAVFAVAPAMSGELIRVGQLDPKSGAYAVVIDGEIGSVTQFTLLEPARIVVDIEQASLSPGLDISRSITPSNTSTVSRIRMGSHPGPRTRIVLDLANAELEDKALFPQLVIRDTASGLSLELPSTDLESQHLSTQVAEQSQQATAKLVETVETVETVESEPPCEGDCEQLAKATSQMPSSFTFGVSATESDEGQRAGKSPAGKGELQSLEPFVSRALLEPGWVADPGSGGVNAHLQLVGGVQAQFSPKLSASFAARIDGQAQSGDLTQLDEIKLDYDETWIRYSSDSLRLTLGAQRIVWGRVDDFAPTDRLSTRDFTRLIMDDLEYRRRANPAVRVQWTGDTNALDLVYLPVFREAELPPDDSVWFPVDSSTGSIAGLPLTGGQNAALIGTTVDNDFEGSEGFGARFSSASGPLDYAISIQRVNNPEPYFTLARAPTDSLPAEIAVVYPRTWVLGVDTEFAVGRWTLRGEIAWLSDSPYTRITDASLQMSEELNWALGAETFPGDGDLRLTFQLSGRHLLDVTEGLDFQDVTTAVGAIESPFTLYGSPFTAKLRYSVRLDERGNYLNPELSYTGLEPSEIYLGVHFFSGVRGTLEGFYQDRDAVVLGWRAKF